ncbi:MAG TPA: LytTR family DNA-binding domain-containing protein [Aquabacterium sp.]|uniref:LytR/AlgR family response regulator transcription factor n=1 Tax=Aquabacterium sp. TaxID=1872578 RepID=UPI002E311BE6|nr:LytTR family DNA-binding domain-containing protein [Aquabacterium sp.]HEX5354820.1 LytTR family DNA-binding domain-containing protein [Aquabacterium sp.]
MNCPPATAIIAEDEPVLARALAKMLGKLWPALQIKAIVHDGEEATVAASQHRPDIIFLDIQMPVLNGLDAAECIVDNWPMDAVLPLIVFVTAFDRFAVDAFERAAVDYVLKPVEGQRLEKTCERLTSRLLEMHGDETHSVASLQALRRVSAGPQPALPPLSIIQAGLGSTVHMVPVTDIHYFEADDKYVRVVTHDRALLIRTPLRDLMPRLDAQAFTQIHRGTVVRTTLIDRVIREDTGRIYLHLRGRHERLTVSRSYAHLFKPM